MHDNANLITAAPKRALSFPKIISGRIYDAAQPRWEWRQ
jgi:hypothetical protein